MHARSTRRRDLRSSRPQGRTWSLAPIVLSDIGILRSRLREPSCSANLTRGAGGVRGSPGRGCRCPIWRRRSRRSSRPCGTHGACCGGRSSRRCHRGRAEGSDWCPRGRGRESCPPGSGWRCQHADVLGGGDREQLAVERCAPERAAYSAARPGALAGCGVFWQAARQLVERIAGIGVVPQELDRDAADGACGSGLKAAVAPARCPRTPGLPVEPARGGGWRSRPGRCSRARAGTSRCEVAGRARGDSHRR